MNFQEFESHLGTCCHHPLPVTTSLNVTDEPLIVMKDVSFGHDTKIVLEHVDLCVNRGDFVAVTGPNGGGKTTLLRLVLGLLRPVSGTIEFPSGRPAVGYLPQKNSIDSHFPISVREVVASGLLSDRSLSRVGRSASVDRALARVEMEDLADRPIGRLSGGQLQRALLGRAIVSDPALLVLDEPLSYIDKHFEAHIYRLIASMAPGCTILLVSHEMSTIDAMANRHIIVDRHLTECHAERHMAVITCDG